MLILRARLLFELAFSSLERGELLLVVHQVIKLITEESGLPEFNILLLINRLGII